MSLVLLTDTGCDLSWEYMEKHDIGFLSLSFGFGAEQYPYAPGLPFSIHDFYERLRAGEMSMTSQVNEETYKQEFSRHLEAGNDVLYIGLSSGITGTMNAAKAAQREIDGLYPDRKLACVDSLCASLGFGLLVHYIRVKRDEGASFDELVQYAEEHRKNFIHWFTVDDLKHLRRGGRISATSAFIGTMLSIKPVLHVDNAGRLIAVQKVSGRGRAVRSLFEHMQKVAIEPEKQTVFISHGDCPEDAEKLRDIIAKELGVKDFYIQPIGPIIGTHSGPGTLALFFYGSER